MKKKHLTQVQRYEISAYLQVGKSKSEIAKQLSVDRSTITREIQRNCDKRSNEYKPELAQRKSVKRLKDRRHATRLIENLKELIDVFIKEYEYSPEQISGRMKTIGVSIVSHETIYKYIWEDKKNGDKQLYKSLRRRGRKYAKRGSAYKSRGKIKDRVDISERPGIVDERIRFGDLEIDTVIGKNHKGALLTINDRKTGMVWIRKLAGKEAAPLTAAAIKALLPFKDRIHTITADNGKEFSFHKEIAEKIEIKVYFAKPYHSWERGANENTNGLIRQYFPKGMDFGLITKQKVMEVQNKLNNRPRKRLGYLSPNELFKQIINNEI